MDTLYLILIVIGIMALIFALIGIKMFLKKGGEFKKQCSSVDPKTGQRLGCSCGGGDHSCHND